MASNAGAPPAEPRKRVKVYELKNNDWYDRGTGFCHGHVITQEDARIFVQSEDDPNRTLLETRIAKDDGYQKQQDTLIVWTEPTGVDMALSFQEPEGCSAIWEFVYEVQQRLLAMAPDDLDDDMLENGSAIMLPAPELGNLHEVENIMRNASQSTPGRDALAKFVMAPDSLYISKLAPLVEMAEDLEDLPDLHRLCNIMKTLILLNDTSIIEFIVRDELILGVVGALEYDPDFPSHKANHRQYLANNSKFKEVVKIDSMEIRRKIHHTYRLHYLKDVVLARILDDPTFSVLNSLIFFHQVDIVNHIQGNTPFLTELFSIFGPQEQDRQRKKDAVLFIQHLCAVAKNIQATSRAQLFQNFINGGLFNVLTFALTHPDAAVRVAGSDILVALIDHDPAMMRTYIFKAINEKTKPLTDTLVELLLVEQDLGVKTQMADAIKVLLDPTSNSTSMDMLGRTNGDFLAKIRSNATTVPQTETFIQNFYDESAKKLFQPLKELEPRKDLSNISVQEASLHEHLVGILCFFLRAHAYRAKYFTLSEGLHARIAQLMTCPQKHLKLAAIRWFRTCISLCDDFHNREIINNRLLEPILALLEGTSQRDNLLNSACLEFFEFVKRDGGKPLVIHLVETFRPRLAAIEYVDTFAQLIENYEKLQAGYQPIAEESSFSTQGANTPNRGLINGGARWGAGLKEADADEEAYFNTSDPEDEGEEDDEDGLPANAAVKPLTNGASPARPLVAYNDDEDDADAMDVLSASPQQEEERPSALPKLKSHRKDRHQGPGSGSTSPDPLQESPPERAEKRRRGEDEEDALDAMASGNVSSKRRNSVTRDAPHKEEKDEKMEMESKKRKSKSPSPGSGKENGPSLRRKGTLRNRDSPMSKVTGLGGISISLKGKDGDD
ncbi:hypothetical protein KVT40_007805 [Elsinoe batatas]|uniref:Serine/threonine-protein phosphatase 4 regulatory subunit 3-like central domain-containing protein n=1 Tax=Elsinoe batatas TaxID=2601811 RepID=A0A8K0KY48_9PEZI|nr:hypothetical protein KVT40_007805 [Elsinoe batatas]